MVKVHLIDTPEKGKTVIGCQVTDRKDKASRYLSVDCNGLETVLEVCDYDMGLQPRWLVADSLVFIGNSCTVFLFDAFRREFVSADTLPSPVFEFLVHDDRIIIICETDIIVMNRHGEHINHISADDILTEWSIKEEKIIFRTYYGQQHEIGY